MIEAAWTEHKAIQINDVLARSWNKHSVCGQKSIKTQRRRNTNSHRKSYQLANDFYGIGFFSADKVALSLSVPLIVPQLRSLQ